MAGGEGCRDERRGSSASEVGTVDGTAKKKKKKYQYRSVYVGALQWTSSITQGSTVICCSEIWSYLCSLELGTFWSEVLKIELLQSDCTRMCSFQPIAFLPCVK